MVSSKSAAKIEIILTRPLASTATEYSELLPDFPKNTFMFPASQRINICLLKRTDNRSATLMYTSFRSSRVKKSPDAVSISWRTFFASLSPTEYESAVYIYWFTLERYCSIAPIRFEDKYRTLSRPTCPLR